MNDIVAEIERANRTILSLANTLKDGQHSHFGAPQPHDIRIKHMGFGDDIADALHDEEAKAWVEAKKAENAVQEAIQELQVNRQTLMANPMGQRTAMQKIATARQEANAARSKYDEVTNRRIEQLQKLVETLGVGQQEQPQGMVLPGDEDQQVAEVSAGEDGSQLDQDVHRAPSAGTAAPTAPKTPTAAPSAPATPSATAPSAPTPPTPKPGQSPAAAGRTKTPRQQPRQTHPLLEHGKRIGQGVASTVRDVGQHYMDVMANTPYDRALTLAEDDPSSDITDDGPVVDAAYFGKHDIPGSPHDQHARPDGSDPDEVAARRAARHDVPREVPAQATAPVSTAEPTYRANQRVALDGTVRRVEQLARMFNDRGIREGMDDEDAEGSKLDEHEDASGSTEHHHHGDISHPHHEESAYSDTRGVRPHQHLSGDAIRKPAAVNRVHGEHWFHEDTGIGRDAKLDNYSSMGQQHEDFHALGRPHHHHGSEGHPNHTPAESAGIDWRHPGEGGAAGKWHTHGNGPVGMNYFHAVGGNVNRALRSAVAQVAKAVQGIDNYDENVEVTGNPDQGAVIGEKVKGVRDVPDTIYPETEDGPTFDGKPDLASITRPEGNAHPKSGHLGKSLRAVTADLALAASLVGKRFAGRPAAGPHRSMTSLHSHPGLQEHTGQPTHEHEHGFGHPGSQVSTNHFDYNRPWYDDRTGPEKR